MRVAVELAWLSPPSQTAYSVGAVIVGADGTEVSRGYSREGGDPIVHAEESALGPVPSGLPPGAGRLADPTVLVAPSWGHPGKTAAHRSYQTIQGLSEHLGLPITSHFAQGQEQELTDSLLRSHSGVVLICWEHKHIPVIASSLPVVSGTAIPRKWQASKQAGKLWVVFRRQARPPPGR